MSGGEGHDPRPDPRLLAGRFIRVGSAVRHQMSEPLSRGGLALLANTGVTGVLGFGYWLIAARLFSTYAVGVAGALIAATTLLSGIGQLNLSGMIMRFLPTANGKSRRLVLVTYCFATGSSALLAAVSLAAIKIFADPGSPLRLNMLQATAFVLAVAATAIFTIEDSVLIGLRRAFWVPVENSVFGVAKILTLFLLAPVGSAFALFSAWMIPLTLTIPVISAVLFYKFLPPASLVGRASRLGQHARSMIIRFAAADAMGGLFTQVWTYILPVLVATSLGASDNALFYTSFLMSSTVDQVAANYASPLTVEGAHSPNQVAQLIRLALKRIYSIIIPVVGLVAIIGHWLLKAFGDKYVSAAPLLALLLAACLPKALSIVYYASCRIQRKTHRSAALQAGVCLATLTSALLLAHPLKLMGVGIAVVSVQSAAGVVSWWALRRTLHQIQGRPGKRGRHRRHRETRGSAGPVWLSVLDQ